MKRIISLLLVFAMMFSIGSTGVTVAWADKADETEEEEEGQSWWDKAKDTASSAASSVKDGAASAGQAISSGASAAGSAIKDGATTAGQAISSGASAAADAVSDTASKAATALTNAIKNFNIADFEDGWKYAVGLIGAKFAVEMGEDYIDEVGAAIQKLQDDINADGLKNAKVGLAQEAGNIAEWWHADTYNIDAAASGSSNNASVPRSNELGSVDVEVNDGTNASLKYYQDAKGSANAQAQAKSIMQEYADYLKSTDDPMSFDDFKSQINFDNNPDLYWSLYKDQVRVIPKGQLADAKQYLEMLIAFEDSKDGANRSHVADKYRETLENLSERIESADGTSSIELSKADAEAIAEVSQQGNFEPSKFKVSLNEVITPSYIANQALHAGASSAAIEAAMSMGPQIYQIIKLMIQTGTIDEEQLKETGLSGLSAGARGFLEGSVSEAILVACQAGKFGTSMTSVSPDVVGALTVVLLDSAIYGYKLASGEITATEYADTVGNEIFVSAVSLGTGALFSVLLPFLPGAYLAGSLVGSMLASAGYSAGKEAVMTISAAGGLETIIPVALSDVDLSEQTEVVSTTLKSTLADFKGFLLGTKDTAIQLYREAM